MVETLEYYFGKVLICKNHLVVVMNAGVHKSPDPKEAKECVNNIINNE